MHARHLPLILSLGVMLVASLGAFAQDALAPADDPNARRIVEEADRIRFPAEGFQVDVAIVTTGKDKEPDERKYRVLSKGNDSTVVMVTEPPSEKGQILLMKGRELWVFLPNISQPVPPVVVAAADRPGRERRSPGRTASDYARGCCGRIRSMASYNVLGRTPSIAASPDVCCTGCGNQFVALRAEFYSASHGVERACTRNSSGWRADAPTRLSWKTLRPATIGARLQR